jgi:hypothetical protein
LGLFFGKSGEKCGNFWKSMEKLGNPRKKFRSFFIENTAGRVKTGNLEKLLPISEVSVNKLALFCIFCFLASAFTAALTL